MLDKKAEWSNVDLHTKFWVKMFILVSDKPSIMFICHEYAWSFSGSVTSSPAWTHLGPIFNNHSTFTYTLYNLQKSSYGQHIVAIDDNSFITFWITAHSVSWTWWKRLFWLNVIRASYCSTLAVKRDGIKNIQSSTRYIAILSYTVRYRHNWLILYQLILYWLN